MNKNKNASIIIALILINFLLLFSPNIAFANTVSECDDIPLKDCVNLSDEEETNGASLEDSKSESSSSFFMNALRMFFALLLILALIYIMVKILGRKNQTLQQSNILENLGGIPLGQNKSIQLIRIGEQVMAVGVGENIELLFEITDEDLIEQLKETEKASLTQNNIVQYITDKMQKSKKKENDTNMFKQLFVKELDKLKDNRNKVIDKHKKRDDLNE